MKKLQKCLALFLTLSMLFSLLAVAASAAENHIDKTAQWADEGKTIADVTLSVPGDVKIQGADIVFVIDKSSCGLYATAQLKEMFAELAAAQAQSGADIKVGVVVFNYTDHVDIPLTKLTYENAATLLNQIQSRSGGTNIDAGLLAAKEMLDADTEVSAENKHVILISDGLTWVFDDDEGVSHTILWKNGNDALYAGTTAYTEIRHVNETYPIPAGFDSWDDYWKQIKIWVAADEGKYDYDISNYGTDEYKAGLKTDAAKAVALTTAEGQNHATNMERAMHEAWETYTALQQAGYNCYINNLSTNASSIGYHFMNMLAGDQKAVDFESIQNTIIYSVAKNSYVEDVIGYGDDYNFDFLVDGKLILTVGGIKYITTKLETAKEGFDVSYSFAASETAEATFWLDYVKGNGTSEEKFIWTFGENLSVFYPAKLDYQVELVSIVNDPTEAVAVVETNKSATLHPVDTDGKEGTPAVFPVPKLEIPKYTVTYLNGEIVLQKTEAHLTGDNIPTCIEPASYVDGDYTYTFSYWKLVSGTEGDNKTVGTTDLVYAAVYISTLNETEDEEIIEDEDVPLAPNPDEAPKTGDNANLMVMIICAVVSAAMVVLVLTKKSCFMTK